MSFAGLKVCLNAACANVVWRSRMVQFSFGAEKRAGVSGLGLQKRRIWSYGRVLSPSYVALDGENLKQLRPFGAVTDDSVRMSGGRLCRFWTAQTQECCDCIENWTV